MKYDLVLDNTLTGDLCFLASLSMNICRYAGKNKIKLKYDENNAAYHVRT
jgi:hypothetical protein